ncbi:MAG: leucine-rich repeat domain-containing protein, partial [Clostridia bacterium]|nr:leucine-rich repeat domain-containing protein [Clostridia bacterium]
MMKLKKCVLIVSFLIMMLVSIFFVVEASPEYSSGYYTFTVTDGEACITDVDTSISGEVTIPSTLDGYPVTSIGSSAFFACSKMTRVVIPEGVREIGAQAFAFCNITHITIPTTLKYVSSNVFMNTTKLNTVNISDLRSWCEIEFCEGASNPLCFSGDLYLNGSLVGGELVIPEGTTRIGSYAFNCYDKIGVLKIPASVTSIGEGAFLNCKGIYQLHISDLKKWCDFNFAEMHDNPLYYAQNLYLNGEEISGELAIPEGVTSIGAYAFYCCDQITDIIIPDSVTSIGECAFYLCEGVKSVSIGKGLESVGKNAFFFGGTLERVNITDVKQWCEIDIAKNLGYYFELQLNNEILSGEINIPEGTKTICESAFYNCGEITSVTIPDSVTAIGDNAFDSCKGMKEVVIPEGVSYIGKNAFASCYSLSNVEIYGSADIKRAAFGWISIYEEGQLAFYAPPKSIEDDEYTIYKDVTILCYTDDSVTIDYANSYDRKIQFLPCKDGCCYVEFVDDAYLKSEATCTDSAVYYLSCECGAVSDETFKSGNPLDHIHDDVCDLDCNRCGDVRKAPHDINEGYESDGSSHWNECSLCNYIFNKNEHKYDSNHDAVCDVCGYERVLVVALTITNQPTSEIAREGEKISTTVIATGEGLTYTWYYTSNGNTTEFYVSSVTGATYTTVMNDSRAGRKVYCVITDKYGNSVTTDTVTLSMKPSLAITKQPTN